MANLRNVNLAITQLNIRGFDLLLSLAGLFFLFPFFVIIALVITIDSKGGVFFKQMRIGQGEVPFTLLKFRTMRIDAEKMGQITIGGRDPRITKTGYFLRKNKLDELPQLINVLKGDMSIVGPRPEVPKYVALYTPIEKKILDIKPGITDYASIQFSNENELLAKQQDPEKYYRDILLHEKIKINQKYIDNYSMIEYFKIILLTLKKVFI